MSSPVELRIMQSCSFPSGMGRYYYNGSYEIIIENLAFEKEVSIRASDGTSWRDIPAKYVESLPGNLEKWEITANENDTEFMVKYVVNGITYWDTNNGKNYLFPSAHDELNVITGSAYPIVLGTSKISSSQLQIHAAVQNLGDSKVVGLLYTTDHWATNNTIYGQHSWTMVSGIEVWMFECDLKASPDVEFALFYQANDSEYWDNNFGRNYSLSAQSKTASSSDSDNFHQEMWHSRMPKAIHHKSKKIPEVVSANKAKIVEAEILSTN